MESFKERLLNHYHLSERGYEELQAPLSFASLPDISGHPMTKAFLQRLDEAKEKKERVLIYGDYDCDGVMSASILLRSLREYGVLADGYLPSRYLDGYGATARNVERIAKKGYKILFCTDNGVTAHEAILKAKSLGMDVLILDHHEFDSVEPETPYVLHPKRLGYGKEENCAGFLAFLFSKALLKRSDPYLLLLGATSTLSDAMPLRNENRDIVRLGLETLNKNDYKEFHLLSGTSVYDEATLQMNVIPKINGVGRMDKGTLINRLLLYFGDPLSPKEAIASFIEEIHAKRKALTKDIIGHVALPEEEPGIVLVLEVPEGLNGLLASRFTESAKKPSAIFSEKTNDPTVLVGSLRSLPGFDLMEAFASMKVPFLHKGGHPYAAGASIKKSDFPLFKKEFLFAILKARFSPRLPDAIPLLPEEITPENYAILRSFAPFGKEWEAPNFILPAIPYEELGFMAEGKYLSFRKGEARIVSFSLGKKDFEEGEKARLIGALRENDYKGRKSLEFLVGSKLRDEA